MSKLPEDPDKLINFLAKYQPIPPPPSPAFHQELQAKLAQSSSQPPPNRWLVPTAIAAGVSLFLGLELFFLAPSKNLELFVIDSWNEPMEADWQFSFLEP